MLARIIEIKNIHEAFEIKDYENLWVLFDLDNTVMWPRLELGGDAWFNCLLTHASQQIPHKETATALVVAVYHSVQSHVRTQAVEPETVTFIQELQARGVNVMGLTARDAFISAPTLRQLHDIGIDFTQIIYCNGGNKGEKLKIFLESCKLASTLPDHIVMFDDKLGHLKHVQAVLESFEIDFTGFRYGFLDEKVKQFDMRTSKIQLAHLKERLPPLTQSAIEQLNLAPTPVSSPDRLSPSLFAHGFFPLDAHREPVKPNIESEVDILTAIEFLASRK